MSLRIKFENESEHCDTSTTYRLADHAHLYASNEARDPKP